MSTVCVFFSSIESSTIKIGSSSCIEEENESTKKENWKCVAERGMKYFVNERGLILLNSLLLWRQTSD